MPNVLLTTACNLSCEYCFAEEKMLGKRKQMSMQDVRKVIAFSKQSDFPVFRVMGGEPTLHPRFPDIIQLALQEGMRVDVLSNATWYESCNELFARISPSRLLFLLNIDHPDNYPPRLLARIEDNLTALAGRKGITLSFNIFEKQPRYQYIFDLTTRYEIRNVRMSFSLPVLGIRNACLDIEEYKEMAAFVMDFIRQAEAKGVTTQLDNAVPLCMFTLEQAGELLLKGVLDLRRNARCEPIVDIGPDLTVWFCFCLSKLYNRHLEEFETLQEIQEYYRRVMSVYQDQIFPMDECYECRYQALWGCQGGCITYSIIKDEGRHLDGGPTEEEDGWQQGTVLALADEVVINRYEIPRESYVLSHTVSGIEIEVDASFKPLWALLDGRQTAQEVVTGFLSNGDSQWMQSPADTFVRGVMGESLNDLLLGLLRQGFLVQRPTNAGAAG